MKKRLIAILVLSIMVVSMIVFSFAKSDFTDMSGHWAEGNVDKLASEGIIDGYQDGTFKPEGTVTYAEFIKMLVVAVTGENPGVSVGGHWATEYYKLASDEKLLNKNDIPEEYLDKKIPRADMAYLASKSVDETLDDEKKELIEDYIKDINVAGNRKSEVIFAYGTGILAGYPDRSFKPSGYLTRAESAAVISRIIDPSLRLEIDFEEEVAPPITGKMPELKNGDDLKEYALNIPDSAKKPMDQNSPLMTEYVKKTLKYYAIVENSSVDFSITENLLGNKIILAPKDFGKGFSVVLWKDGEYLQTADLLYDKNFALLGFPGYYEKEIPDFDYFGFCKSGYSEYDTMILVPNPFK